MFNKKHSVNTKLLMSLKKQKEVLLLDKDTKDILHSYPSIQDLAKFFNIHSTTITRYI